MKILITGGAGFIGSQLGLFFLQKKHDVIFVDNLSYGYIENIKPSHNQIFKPNFINMDICDPKIEKIFKGIDIIFHLAGITSLPECQNNPGKAYEVNVSGTANILEAARRQNIKRVVFSSTSAIYENEKSFPTPEVVNSTPNLIYSLSKKHAEEICYSYQQTYGMDITILRFFNVYGPHMDFRRPNPPLVSYIIKCLLDKKAPVLHSDGKQARDMIYIDDILQFCNKVLTNKNAKNQVFNVGSGKTYTVKEIYGEVVKAFHQEESKPTFRSPLLLWEKYPHLFEGKYSFSKKLLQKEVNKYTQASIKKAQKQLHWRPEINLQQGIKKTVEFAIKNT
jgi:UDP-glucose 4-epimerase